MKVYENGVQIKAVQCKGVLVTKTDQNDRSIGDIKLYDVDKIYITKSMFHIFLLNYTVELSFDMEKFQYKIIY